MIEAENALRIAEDALEMLENETDKKRFRVEYYAAMTSLRSIGHILDKVDSKNNSELSIIISNWWRNLKDSPGDNAIFFEFIEKERNQLLKEGVLNCDFDLLGWYLDVDGMAVSIKELDDSLLFVPVQDGPYKNEDVRDVISKAIEWWKKQLSSLETYQMINEHKK